MLFSLLYWLRSPCLVPGQQVGPIANVGTPFLQLVEHWSAKLTGYAEAAIRASAWRM
jgi:hypothetical protein